MSCCSPVTAIFARPGVFNGDPSDHLNTPSDFPSLMAAFSKMLSRGLAHTASQITSTIHVEIQHLGSRIDSSGKKADQTIARTNRISAGIQDLKDQLETAMCNQQSCSFIKKLILDIPEHRLGSQGPPITMY